MTYNVFGGTLNLAQLNLVSCILPSQELKVSVQTVDSYARQSYNNQQKWL